MPHITAAFAHLLLHDLVKDGTGGVAHLVKFVDAADAAVAQHQRTGFQHNLSRLRVAGDVGRQTNSRRAFSRGVHAARRQLHGVLQQLRLAGTRISAQQDVNLGSGMVREYKQNDGRILRMRIYDEQMLVFAVTLTSPRKRPRARCSKRLCVPPNNMASTPFLTSSKPKMLGAVGGGEEQTMSNPWQCVAQHPGPN